MTIRVYRCRIEARIAARTREEAAKMFINWINVSVIAPLTVVCEEEAS